MGLQCGCNSNNNTPQVTIHNTGCNCGCQSTQNPRPSVTCDGIEIPDLPTIQGLSLDDWLVVYDNSTKKTCKVTIGTLFNFLSLNIGSNSNLPSYFDYVNLTTKTIPYTPLMKTKYGVTPTVTVYDINNNIVVNVGISFDNVNDVTSITITTDNPENLIIKIN